MTQAILLGSIGTLADTSELQRRAFNDAFAEHGLDWHWARDEYRNMLETSGGAARIRAQADARGTTVDADAVHATKSERFRDYLAAGEAKARPGVLAVIEQTAARGMVLGLVTTTSRANVDRLLAALDIPRDRFDVIVTREDVSAPKPAPDCYHLAAASLAVAPERCTAIEDNVDGATAALRAGMACLAWPNANTRGHDFGAARREDGDIAQVLFPERIAAE